jgi:hypothetical protein
MLVAENEVKPDTEYIRGLNLIECILLCIYVYLEYV